MAKAKSYFVSYSYICDSGQGYGSVYLQLKKDYEFSSSDVLEYIYNLKNHKAQKNAKAVILNYFEISSAEFDANNTGRTE